MADRRSTGGDGAPGLAGVPAGAQLASVDPRTDCLSYPGDPEPGTPEWDDRDQNNIYCAIEGLLIPYRNPAYQAALAANLAHGSVTFPNYQGDPFREPFLRLGGVRGDVQKVGEGPVCEVRLGCVVPSSVQRGAASCRRVRRRAHLTDFLRSPA
jgi:hypothetical protein